MRRILFVIIRAVVILFIANIITNNYFAYNVMNIFILSMLSFPGIVVIYILSIL